MARALMIQGTASHVGKSVLTAAFGRWLLERGVRVAPFKAQNMSLNSFVTLAGEEMARSQATQADALGLEPTADMNPILLKPLDRGCQVIVQGHGVGIMSIHDYYAYKREAWHAVATSYDRLAGAYEAIVLEGAGSPVEINLTAHDLVNMRMAAHAHAAVILVADIERGGVFAQLIGTWELLSREDRGRVVGFIINKFRGDLSLLTPGFEYVQAHTGRPVLGVLPYDPGVQLDEEDSLGLPTTSQADSVEIAVLRLPGLSNFTDLAVLARLPGVAVRYVGAPEHLHEPDLIVVPGTRTTLQALDWLRASGLGRVLCKRARQPSGPYMIGLCGGFQLLGETIQDPDGIEAAAPCTAALGLLPVDTAFVAHKTLYRVQGEIMAPGSIGHGCHVIGYEVHHGQTYRREGTSPWLRLQRQPGGEMVDDGAVSANGRICGTYVHGLFDDGRMCRSLVATLRRGRGLASLADQDWLSQRTFWATRYARLAGWLQAHCDLRPVLRALDLPA